MSNEPLRISLKEISETEFFRNPKMPQDVGSINELSETEFRKGLMNCVFSGRKSIPQDIVKKSIDFYDDYVSSFAVEEGKVLGLFLVRKNEMGELELIMLQSVGKDYSKRLVAMVLDAFRTAINLYSDDTVVVIPQNTPEARALTKKLFPGK